MKNSNRSLDLSGQTAGSENRAGRIAFLFVVSVLGLVASASLLATPIPSPLEMSGRKMIVALLYCSVCLSGITAALFPVTCGVLFGIRKSSTQDLRGLEMRATRVLGVVVVHGHHPPESHAMIHELRWRGKSFCANCYGLLTGAALASVTMVSFALLGWTWGADTRIGYALYTAGVIAVVAGFAQSFLSGIGARARFIFALLFVFGTSLMLVATDSLTESFVADLFVVFLSVFWLLWRISLSHPG